MAVLLVLAGIGIAALLLTAVVVYFVGKILDALVDGMW